jgi:vacuolar protein sorting-associated protein 54
VCVAISTVLNNPHKKQAPPKAHSHLPTVPTADLPRVKRRDFDGYLNSIGPEWDRFQKSSRLGREGAADLSGLSSSAGASSSFSLGNNNGSSVPATPTTPSTPLPPVKETLPSLDTVPTVFFERNFDLGNPRTFALVTDPSSSSSSFSSLGSSSTPGSFAASSGSDSSDLTPTSLAHAGPLLDHLSHHADTIEQHLVLEIQARSSSFFAALTNLHDLRSESAQCLSRTQNLRAQLSAIGEGGARPGLEAVRREVKVGNVRRVKEGVGVVERTVGMTGEARGLVEAGEWSRALGMVERMEGMWEHGETAENEGDGIDPVPRKGIALSSLKAFSALPDHLRALTLEIASSLTSELVCTLQSDWGERAQPRAEDEPWDDTTARETLRPLVDGLIRTKSVMPALEKWRESVTGMVKSLIRSVGCISYSTLGCVLIGCHSIFPTSNSPQRTSILTTHSWPLHYRLWSTKNSWTF